MSRNADNNLTMDAGGCSHGQAEFRQLRLSKHEQGLQLTARACRFAFRDKSTGCRWRVRWRAATAKPISGHVSNANQTRSLIPRHTAPIRVRSVGARLLLE
jgi:hypothetical protein